MACSAAPAAPARDALDLLAGWAATVDQDDSSGSGAHPAS